MPFVSSIRLLALMLFIALVAVAVWLADLRLAIALPLVAVAWLIAATIEWLAWRAAHAPVAVVETAPVVPPPPPPASDEVIPPEPEAAPVPDLAPPPMALERFEPIAAGPELEAVAEPATEPAAEPEREPEPPPVVEPDRVVAAEPELEPDAEPATELEPADFPEPADTAIITAAERPPRWARRRRLRAVPAPPAEAAPPPPAAMPPPEHGPQVVSFPQRSYQPRRWNIWDLERSARAEAAEHPELREEWSFLFVHLRQFANADGELPAEFDSLVRESFGSLLERQPIR